MSLYQRRLASSTYAVRRSLENRAKRLEVGLKKAQELAQTAPPDLPDPDELEEMEEAERERLEEILEAITLASNRRGGPRRDCANCCSWPSRRQAVEDAGVEAKLSRLKDLMHEQGFFDQPDQRLLIFTEFKDTLDYLVERLRDWGFQVGCIHGSMKLGLARRTGHAAARRAAVPGWRDPGPGGHRGGRRRHQPPVSATSCSTTTSPGTPTGSNSGWAASTVTASARTA